MSAIAPLPAPVSPSKSSLGNTAVANLWKWAGLAQANDTALRAEVASLEQQLANARNIAAAIARIETAVTAGGPSAPPDASERYVRETWRVVPRTGTVDVRDFVYEQHLTSSTKADFDAVALPGQPTPPPSPLPVDRIVGPTSAIPLIAGTDTWKLENGVAILNGVPTPSGSVILLYRDPQGVVWQENSSQNWWKWIGGAQGSWLSAPSPL